MIKDSIADQLVYSTARITCANTVKTVCGTGFFMLHAGNLAFVTNKHVVKDFLTAKIDLVGSDENDNPVDAIHICIEISDLQRKCVYHPESDVDICFVIINTEIEELRKQGKNPYFRCIGSELLLRDNDYSSLTAIEDIIMIGYPSGIMDDYNYKPVVRKGITATSLKLNYGGKPIFLIDAACFPGSSGSPVFLRKVGLEKEKTETGIMLGVSASYSLLGLLFEGPTLTVNGKIIIKDIPTSAVPVAEMKTMMNLGSVVKIQKAVELFELLESK